ncbi:hypothetical protein M2132_001836 [Dysgonomonas sp. PH5-45]|uniref:hypothetical protein n=1 Tax=unclassified Dysgonomonas TaxID=2630389 RepID=UPI00247303F0|nr:MULTISPECIES: hypothetical protein [unclassified Dysgonomonas]MDH6355493.1 hypothetical protein [Dysgonomonas sp. PH5-45]MDH6388389.1 hypothetical protein [Dysgonomonas sp. PH5-37]
MDKKIEIAGIPFTNDMLEELRRWTAPDKSDDSQLQQDIDAIDAVQSFLMFRWEHLGADDQDIKHMLISMQVLKETLNKFKLNP